MYTLIWQSADALVAYKHAGASFHSEEGGPGFFETLRQREGLDELYPVHRLDKITSGLVVMARTAAANRQLCEQFAQRTCEKYYLALTDRKPRRKQGSVVGDMQAGRRGNWRLSRSLDNPARTHLLSQSAGGGLRLWLVRPLTGKTHQIRVALKSLGAPILGDERYGGTPSDRAYLHAWSLGFRMGDRQWRFTEAPREGELFDNEEMRTLISAWSPPGEPL